MAHILTHGGTSSVATGSGDDPYANGEAAGASGSPLGTGHSQEYINGWNAGHSTYAAANPTEPGPIEGYEQRSLQQTSEDILATQGPFASAALREQQSILPRQTQLSLELQRQYAPQFLSLQTQLADAERASTLNNIESLTPQVNAIDRAAMGAENAAIYDELQSQTLAGIDANGQLTADEQRNAEQAQRSADASRGIVSGSGSSNREAVELSLAGSDKQAQQQAQASSFLALDNSLSSDPFTVIGGMPTPATSISTAMVPQPAPINGQQTSLQALGATTASNQANLQLALAQQAAFENERQFELASAQPR